MLKGAPPPRKTCIACPSDTLPVYESLCGIPLCNECMEKIGAVYEFLFLSDPDSPHHKAVIPAALRRQVFQRDGFKCQHCGSGDHLSADHILPESRGGPTIFRNLQTLCRSCNSKKGTKCAGTSTT